MVRPVAQAQADDKNAEFSPLALFNFFVSCCRENLHVMLCMSPIGDAFRNRLRQFPSLVNCCTIDWFQVRIYVYFLVFVPPPEGYDSIRACMCVCLSVSTIT
jgi:hypothetical protein